jgi:ABC-type multidrug transport system fused ATPase/permease subunit
MLLSECWVCSCITSGSHDLTAIVYTELPAEGDTKTPNDPPISWPERGEIKFVNAELAYRTGLPLVLKRISFEVKPGENV